MNNRICKVISIMLVMVLTSAMVITPIQMKSYNGSAYDAELIEVIVEDDELFNSLDGCEQLDAIELYIYTIECKLYNLQLNQEQ